MVIVARMRRGWTRDKDAFLAFLDGFPPNCLAVPFRAKSHRHRVCKSLGGMQSDVTFMVDPNQTVLLYSPVSGGIHATSFVPIYWANSTPFPFVSKKVTYAKIPLGNGAFHQENVSISELKSKLVGLYLFTSGHMIPMLPKIAQACLQNGKELEIVLVYFPGINTAHDPQSAKQDFLNVLAKRNLPWWVAPYNSTASIMLNHMFECGERIVILGPNGLFVEPRGAELMQMFGYAYPFRLDCVVQKISEELRQVTLESFLKLLEIQEFRKMKKKILLYFDYPFHIHHDVYAAVKGFSKCNDVQIIMVSLSDGEFSSEITTLQDSDSRDYS
uniref:Uncharacterized protein n=1 Tax=Chenopodium quinoa TaxID=63459 RepID=A0A803L1M1_CHEQI